MVSVCTALYYTSLAYGTQNEIAVEVFSTAQPAQIPTVDDALAFCMTDTQYSLSLESFSVAAVVSGGDQLAAPVGQAGVLSSQGFTTQPGQLEDILDGSPHHDARRLETRYVHHASSSVRLAGIRQLQPDGPQTAGSGHGQATVSRTKAISPSGWRQCYPEARPSR